MRILHLGFEDPRRPGSGGGSVRTHEVNRRLAGRHDITVVTAKFPGWRDRVEDGVRYLHAGVEAGYVGSVASYFLALPRLARRHDYDLLVEDFGAPISSVLAPLWSKAPCVAMVQWLFAQEMAHKYHLPVHLVERLGVRSHRRMIALSADLAGRLRAANPGAEVEVIPEGVDAAAFDAAAPGQCAAVYLGRLESHQKGLDWLLDAFAIAARSTQARLVIAGDGPDRELLLKRCARLGIRDRVEFAGRVSGAAKFALLASAQVVCMPSRYETFGIVAAEALACGTPVLAFDIDCLREVIPADAGRLVPVGDVAAYAAALVELLGRPDLCQAMGERGRRFARRFDWDEIAERQERVYLQAAGRPAPPAWPGRRVAARPPAGEQGWPPRHAIVTGGTAGIGLATAGRLVGLGAHVSLLALDGIDEALATLRAAPLRPGQQLDAVRVDVTDAAAVRAAVAAQADRLGPCDLLLTAAGGAAPGWFHQLDDAVLRRQMELNYFGTVHAVRAVLPAMLQRGQGRIVLVSSTLGVTGGFGYAAYSAAKFAVRGLAEALRGELRPHGILVACAIPAATDTPGRAREELAKPELVRRAAPPGRLLRADEVAAAIVDGARRGRFLITADRRTQAAVRLSSVLAPLLRARADLAVDRAGRRGRPAPPAART